MRPGSAGVRGARASVVRYRGEGLFARSARMLGLDENSTCRVYKIHIKTVFEKHFYLKCLKS